MKRKPKELNPAELKADAFLLLRSIYSFIQDNPKITQMDFERKAGVNLLPAIADFLQERERAEKEREKIRREHRKEERELLKKGQLYFKEMKKIIAENE